MWEKSIATLESDHHGITHSAGLSHAIPCLNVYYLAAHTGGNAFVSVGHWSSGA